jgi:methyl-accepting chemotaxis protein
MNTSDRLDRIERILEQVAHQQQINTEQISANTEQISANTQQIAANTEGMTELRTLLRDFLQARQQ